MSFNVLLGLCENADIFKSNYSPAAEVSNLASLDNFFSLLIISLWDIWNNIQVGVEFLPLGN